MLEALEDRLDAADIPPAPPPPPDGQQGKPTGRVFDPFSAAAWGDVGVQQQ